MMPAMAGICSGQRFRFGISDEPGSGCTPELYHPVERADHSITIIRQFVSKYFNDSDRRISEQLVEKSQRTECSCERNGFNRLTTIAHVSMTPIEGQYVKGVRCESYNHYFGWYGGKWKTMVRGWTTSIKFIRKSALDCRSMDVKESSRITVRTRRKDTVRNIRRCTMSIWQKCWKNVHGSGPAMFKTCLISDVQPETKAADETIKVFMTIDRKVKKTATIFIRHTGIKTDGTSLRKTVCTACGRNDEQIRVYSNQPSVILF